MNQHSPLVLLIEKVLWTFAQAFASFLLAADLLDVSTAQAAILAAVAAAGTALANGLPIIPDGLPFYTDLTFRVVRTYAVSFLTLFFGVPVFEPSTAAATGALVAAVPAALSIVKGAAAKRIGSSDDAATLPAAA